MLQKEHDSEPPINWTPDTASQKRKRQSGDEQEIRPSKQNKGPLEIDKGNGQSPHQSLIRKAPHRIQTVSPYTLSQISCTDMTGDGNPQDLPELTHSGATSPPDVDELCSLNNMIPSENPQQGELHDHELEWLRDLPGTKSNIQKPPLQHKDNLFSLYLRSRSPTCSSAKSIGHDNNDGSIHPRTVTSSDICLSAEDDHHLAGLADFSTYLRPSASWIERLGCML